MTIARFIAISIFMPILSKSGYGLTWKEMIVLTHGGLRGVIGIAFSLIVSNISSMEQNFRKIVLFHMSGCIFMTLVINAPTTGWLVKKVGLSVKNPTR